MTANLSLGRPRLADIEPRARQIAGRAESLRQQLARLADADAEAFDQVRAAYRLPRPDAAQRAARSEAIQAALLTAAAVALETAQLCASGLEVAEEAAPILNVQVISDVMVGALLARAGLDGAALNVEINLASMTDAASVARLSGDLARAQAGVNQRVER